MQVLPRKGIVPFGLLVALALVGIACEEEGRGGGSLQDRRHGIGHRTR